MNKKWEYAIANFGGVPTKDQLDSFGEDRWELVAIGVVYGNLVYHFKREIELNTKIVVYNQQ